MRWCSVRLGVFSVRILKSASPWERNLPRFLLTIQVPEFLENLGMAWRCSGGFPFVFGARGCGIRCRSWSGNSKSRPRSLLSDVGLEQAETRLQFPLADAAPPLGQGQSLLSLRSGEKRHGFLHPNPALSAVERSKRMSRWRSVCCRSLGNITSAGLSGRAPLAGDVQLSQLQESRRWLTAAIPAQIEAPSAASTFS